MPILTASADVNSNSRSDVVLKSNDGSYSLRISDRLVRQLLEICQKADPYETGGILVGYYDESGATAVVTEVTGPPRDSQAGRSRFCRGVDGLQSLLDQQWPRRYYLGEWHRHPGGLGTPSAVDRCQLREIASSMEYQCPEPLLVIVGDSLAQPSIDGFVFPRGEDLIELAYVDPPRPFHQP